MKTANYFLFEPKIYFIIRALINFLLNFGVSQNRDIVVYAGVIRFFSKDKMHIAIIDIG